jgi:hypothetical protein
MAFIRQHMLAGDPLGAVGLATRRKSAGAGTRAKAYRHRVVRMQRMNRTFGDPFMGMVGGAARMAPAALSTFAKGSGGAGGFMQGLGKFASGLFGGKQVDMRAIGGAAAQLGSGALASLQRRGAAPTGFGPMPTMSGFLPGMDGGGGRAAGGFGGKRRTMNVANVKALKRSIRRLDGFKGLVKKVNQLLPAAARLDSGAPRFKAKRKRR